MKSKTVDMARDIALVLAIVICIYQYQHPRVQRMIELVPQSCPVACSCAPLSLPIE